MATSMLMRTHFFPCIVTSLSLFSWPYCHREFPRFMWCSSARVRFVVGIFQSLCFIIMMHLIDALYLCRLIHITKNIVLLWMVWTFYLFVEFVCVMSHIDCSPVYLLCGLLVANCSFYWCTCIAVVIRSIQKFIGELYCYGVCIDYLNFIICSNWMVGRYMKVDKNMHNIVFANITIIVRYNNTCIITRAIVYLVS